jgi:rubredoxin
MSFKTMDPKLAWEAIRPYTNELESENTKLEAFYRQFVCPACKGHCVKEYSPSHAFSDPGTLVARALLRCTTCRHLFDPHSGMTVEVGNSMGKVNL